LNNEETRQRSVIVYLSDWESTIEGYTDFGLQSSMSPDPSPGILIPSSLTATRGIVYPSAHSGWVSSIEDWYQISSPSSPLDHGSDSRSAASRGTSVPCPVFIPNPKERFKVSPVSAPSSIISVASRLHPDHEQDNKPNLITY